MCCWPKTRTTIAGTAGSPTRTTRIQVGEAPARRYFMRTVAAESRLYRESADVFNMLVSIYDCKDLFVKEYQCQLANNLISNGWGKQMDSEAKYLEKMKRRFSENELNQCEVMLKDIRDSSRLYGIAVHEGMHVPFLPQIVSHVFWPELKRDVKMDVRFDVARAASAEMRLLAACCAALRLCRRVYTYISKEAADTHNPLVSRLRQLRENGRVVGRLLLRRCSAAELCANSHAISARV